VHRTRSGSRTLRVGAGLALALALAFPHGAAAADPGRAKPAAEADRATSGAEPRSDAKHDARDRADARLRTRVVERLAASRALEGAEIRVTVEDRRVTLHGRAPDERSASRALAIARRTPGVRSVDGERVEIDPSLGERPRPVVGDEALSEAVARALVEALFPEARAERDWTYGWEVDGFNWEFDVEVDRGDVTLSGTVPSRRALERTIAHTREVAGVRSVHSRLGFVDPLHWAAGPARALHAAAGSAR